MKGIAELKQIGPYKLYNVIGQGATSVVRMAQIDGDYVIYAIKIIPKKSIAIDRDVAHRFQVEARVTQQVHHPNLVQLHDIYKDKHYYYLVLDYCNSGSLLNMIISEKRLHEDDARYIMKQVFEGLKFLHQIGICHRDMKPENILLGDCKDIKISDFGLSKFVSSENLKSGKFLVSTPVGSPCYSSPEALNIAFYNAKHQPSKIHTLLFDQSESSMRRPQQTYDGIKSDIWSCGVVLYTCVVGRIPWEGNNQGQIFAQIRSCRYEIPSFVSKSCASLIHGILRPNPSDRLTIDEILDHKWFKEGGIRWYNNENFLSTPMKILSLNATDRFFQRDRKSDLDNEMWNAIDDFNKCYYFHANKSLSFKNDNLPNAEENKKEKTNPIINRSITVPDIVERNVILNDEMFTNDEKLKSLSMSSSRLIDFNSFDFLKKQLENDYSVNIRQRKKKGKYPNQDQPIDLKKAGKHSSISHDALSINQNTNEDSKMQLEPLLTKSSGELKNTKKTPKKRPPLPIPPKSTPQPDTKTENNQNKPHTLSSRLPKSTAKARKSRASSMRMKQSANFSGDGTAAAMKMDEELNNLTIDKQSSSRTSEDEDHECLINFDDHEQSDNHSSALCKEVICESNEIEVIEKIERFEKNEEKNEKKKKNKKSKKKCNSDKEDNHDEEDKFEEGKKKEKKKEKEKKKKGKKDKIEGGKKDKKEINEDVNKDLDENKIENVVDEKCKDQNNENELIEKDHKEELKDHDENKKKEKKKEKKGKKEKKDDDQSEDGKKKEKKDKKKDKKEKKDKNKKGNPHNNDDENHQ